MRTIPPVELLGSAAYVVIWSTEYFSFLDRVNQVCILTLIFCFSEVIIFHLNSAQNFFCHDHIGSLRNLKR